MGRGNSRRRNHFGNCLCRLVPFQTPRNKVVGPKVASTRSIGTASAVTTNTQRYIGLGARYYDATTGRFTQTDPAGKEANPYSYAGCNPVNANDPTGLSDGAAISKAAAIGGIAGAAGGCVAGAVVTIWTGPGAAAACGICAVAGLVGGAVTGAAESLLTRLLG
ncbi:RHS repeat-associated core domain-containing protein [Cryobacterium zhongshanensis]|uniref:RHS repeat-associated core domain-containing protein n=1 Tax=Cryobacterium zhongshanensis TaxID=2928153 RepID=A0AA41QVK4_9MICO|nr:RHS repeat-associated core domain-containing protein [Cryobacterium zhongshanensis]MCI4658080.1 RHS repeat-associated core domain-containing protein [Cryobacterium zhongshanensis]